MSCNLQIVTYKRRAGLSIRDLSTACGVGKSAVTSWMSGANRPNLDHLVKLAKAFGLGDGERLAFYESAADV